MNDNAQQGLLEHLSVLLGPLRAVAQSEYLLRNMARSVGWDLDEITGLPIGDLQGRLNELVNNFESLSASLQSPPQTLSELSAALDAADHAFSAIRNISTILAEGAQPSQFKEFGRDLISALTIAHLQVTAPLLYDLAVLLTVIEPANNQLLSEPVFDSAGNLVRIPHTRPRLRLSRIVDLIKSPEELLKSEYVGQGGLETATDARRTADKLFPRLGAVLSSLGANVAYGFKPGYGIDLGDPDNLAAGMLTFWLDLEGLNTQAGATLSLSPAEQGNLGLVVSPFGSVEFAQPFESWALSASLTAGVDAFALGPNGFRLLLGEGGSGDRVSVRLELARQVEPEGSVTRIGSTTGTRLEAKRLRVLGEANLAPTEQEYGLLAEVGDAALVVAPGDGDGFLKEILPADGLRAKFDLAFGWSNRKGFYFRGGAGLEAQLPLHISLGPISVKSVHLAIRAEGKGIRNELAATVSVRFGPVNALVERVGLAATLTFPEEGANLGAANLDFGFKPPNGLGLAIDAAGVTGGGFLFFDQEKGQYAGFVQLNIEGGITVTAIGLIATRLPGGAKGFSFVVMITAENFKPIALGLGFTLTGIGGLLAVNRTCSEEFLREGIKDRTLDNLLFPKDPIRNAPQIFGVLNNAFPPRDGSYLFGPVVRICWGSPPVLTMDLGLVLELGNRTRLVVLGRVSAILPSEKHDLIRLQMNTLGIIDFDQRSVSLDAVLYDSRLLNKFPLTGSMAMRLNWGASPSFALSIGGFYPAFKPPSGFPALGRITLSLSETGDFRLRCDSYFAITSNTLQFGSHAELMARAHGFSIEGRIGFDVLIQFDPFGFLAEFYASVQLKRGSRNLFAVKVRGELAGPRPLHVKGKATFEIFWCDFSVGFDKTLVSGEAPPKSEPVKVLEQLKVALQDPRNWSGQLADGERRLVTLRESRPADQIALHPLGKLSVKQRVVPLELQIDKFGNAKPAGARLFKVDSLRVNGNSVAFKPEKDLFAPAQFLELSDDEKLAAPSFEAMVAGISVGAESFIFTANDGDILEDEAITYETIIVDKENNQLRRAAPFTITAESLSRQVTFGAAARSDVRRTGGAKYRPAEGKNWPIKKGWMIVSSADGSQQAAPGLEAGKVVTYADSFQALQRLKREDPAKAKALMLIRVSASVN